MVVKKGTADAVLFHIINCPLKYPWTNAGHESNLYLSDT